MIKNVENFIVNDILYRIQSEFDDNIIKALEAKGYKFENRNELKVFIEKYCRAEKNGKTTVYFVKEKMFLKYTELDRDFKIDKINSAYTISIDYGKFELL